MAAPATPYNCDGGPSASGERPEWARGKVTEDAHRQIRRTLIVVLGLNLAVAAAKLAVGYLTGSVSMQADGLHSLVDASSNLVGLAGVWLAARPADANHPYGHRKYETLASIAIGALLLYTVVEILRGAVERLLGGGQPEATALSFAVMLATIAINIIVSIWERRQGQQLGSDVLIADATQTRADVFVSLAVVASLLAVRAGYPQIDALVALGVAALVARAAWQVLRQASAVLSDEAALPEAELDALVRAVPGVEGTHRIWTRGHRNEVFVDLDIQVDAAMTVEQGHELAHAVRDRIRGRWPTVRHIMVHVEPVVPADAGVIRRIHHLARRRGLNVHDVRVHSSAPDWQEVALHLEVDPQLTLGEAHGTADELEEAIRTDLPAVGSVTTHIEGAPAAVEPREDVTTTNPALVATVERVAGAAIGAGRCHAVRVYRSGNGDGDGALYDLVMHCTLPEGLPLPEAHERAEQVERALRAAVPKLGAVTVHAEPPERATSNEQ